MLFISSKQGRLFRLLLQLSMVSTVTLPSWSRTDVSFKVEEDLRRRLRIALFYPLNIFTFASEYQEASFESDLYNFSER